MTPARRANLIRLLTPRHVAVIGGDEAAVAAEQCAAAGFEGPIWGVNPRREMLGGQPCVAHIGDLPEAPDAVFLAIPREATIETVRELRDLGAGGVVCFAAGYGELGDDGVRLERDLITAAGDLALVGPNCYGLLNYVRRAALWPYGHGGGPVERGVALVTQSGMLGTTLTLNERSVPLAYVISAGNAAVLGVEDYIDVLVDDPAVTAIGLYLEGLGDIPRFADAAVRALEAGIPIVAHKAGHSEIGARLTITHTGSISGEDEAYQALFDRLGVVRVRSPVMLLETLKMLTVAGAPNGPRLAAFTCSGGDATMLADGAAAAGVTFPQPSPAVARKLATHLPEIATVSNPLDYTTPLWGDEENLPGVYEAMFADAYDAALLVQDYPHPETGVDAEFYRRDARVFMAATQAAGIPAAICSVLPENLDEETRATMIAGGVAPLQGIDEALTAIGAAAAQGRRRAGMRSAGETAALRLPEPPQLAGVHATLDEWQGKRRLTETGIAVPEGRLVDAASAPAAAAALGFPVAVKAVSDLLPHKSEAGALRLGLDSADAVERAVADITRSVALAMPDAVCEQFLVERFVGEPVAELLVGIRGDPLFGQTMVLASGGILVELVGDSRTLLLPTDRAAVAEALASLKVSRLIAGHRGRPAGDRDAVIDAVLALAAYADAHRSSLVELEINPLMVLADAVIAADVLIRVASTGAEAAA